MSEPITNNMDQILFKLKNSEIHIPTFLVISTTYILVYFDLDCSDYLGPLTKFLFSVSLIGLLIVLMAVVWRAEKPAQTAIVTGLVICYQIVNALLFVSAFIILIVHESSSHQVCMSDGVLEYYYVWMSLTQIAIVLYSFYQKKKTQNKMEAQQELIMRGSVNKEELHGIDSFVMGRTSVKSDYQ